MTSTSSPAVDQSGAVPGLAVVEAYLGALNDDDLPGALTYLADDFHYEDPVWGTNFDKEPFAEYMRNVWLGALARWNWKLEQVIFGGHRCAASWVFTGAQKALPPADLNFFAGEPVRTDEGFPFLTKGISTFRFNEDWLLTEEVDYWTGTWVAG